MPDCCDPKLGLLSALTRRLSLKIVTILYHQSVTILDFERDSLCSADSQVDNGCNHADNRDAGNYEKNSENRFAFVSGRSDRSYRE